jgi:hypothetical protein
MSTKKRKKRKKNGPFLKKSEKKIYCKEYKKQRIIYITGYKRIKN